MKNIFFFFFLAFTSSITKTYSQETSLYPSLSAGIKTPEVTGKDQNGKKIRLSKVKSRYTLLYFYEVHCHLCESITPKLLKLYEGYRSTGLEVVAIPLESTRMDWKNYIAEHKLNWKNLFPDEKGVEKLKKDYLFTVSPTFYLLDRDKNLLTGRLVRLEQVEEELNTRIR